MPRYDGAGKNRSAMVHASRPHTCVICGQVVYGNGGVSSHGRKHVRRGEAVELEMYYGLEAGTSRLFFTPDDERIAHYEAKGFARVMPADV